MIIQIYSIKWKCWTVFRWRTMTIILTCFKHSVQIKLFSLLFHVKFPGVAGGATYKDQKISKDALFVIWTCNGMAIDQKVLLKWFPKLISLLQSIKHFLWLLLIMLFRLKGLRRFLFNWKSLERIFVFSLKYELQQPRKILK